MSEPSSNALSLAARRREQLFALYSEDILILPSSAEQTKNADVNFPFRQDSDFYYLSLFPEPESLIVLDRKSQDYFLFVPPRDPHKEVWEGKRFGPEGAKDIFEASLAFDNNHKDALAEIVSGRTVRYFSPKVDYPMASDWLETIKSTSSNVQESDRKELHRMRMVKDSWEIQQMRQACAISSQAHKDLMMASPKSKAEYQLEGTFINTCMQAGARDQAYPSIVAGGANATCLHYKENNQNYAQDSFILVDAGCSWNNYAADITRTFPANGKFSGAFEKVYDAVLSIQKACLDSVKPGVTYMELQSLSNKISCEKLIELGIIQKSFDEAYQSQAYAPYTLHSLGHLIGLDVHDCPDLPRSAYKEELTLKAGICLTIEPGLYFQVDDLSVAPEWRGIGIRIEDDVLVTETGCEVLSAACPKEKSEIEALMVNN